MRSVLILGANSDIAVETARKFAAENYDVVLAGRNLEQLEILKNDLIVKHKVNVNTAFFDALDFDTHNSFITSFTNFPSITICAFGYLGDQNAAQEDFGETHRIISTNFTGAVSILNLIAGLYEDRRAGTIVGISSVAGERGRQSNYIYGSSKAAFTAYLSGMRNRLFKSNVHVVTVKPGFVETKMTHELDLPPLLTAKPTEVANRIFKAVEEKQNQIYVLGVWKLIMWVIRSIPEFVFKKLNL